MKQLKTASTTQRNKNEPVLILSLLYLAKRRPQYFNTELIVEALLALLRRDSNSAIGPFKGKITSSAAVSCYLVVKMRGIVLKSFLKVFIEASVSDRIRVDCEECQGFVENILTAFNTQLSSKNLIQHDGATVILPLQQLQ